MVIRAGVAAAGSIEARHRVGAAWQQRSTKDIAGRRVGVRLGAADHAGQCKIDGMSNAVLVVGAGPVGLTAALLMARHGTPVRIIDTTEQATTLSKALVVWRRSLQVLDPVVPWDHVLEGHQQARRGLFFDNQRPIAELSFDTPNHAMPAGVFIPQCDTESLLIEALAGYGVHVERSTTLAAFTADDTGVDCTLKTPDGQRTMRTPWLVGCDGAHSTVRHTLGLEFKGETADARWLLADVRIEGESPEDAAIMEGGPEGPVALFPVGDHRWRIIASASDGAGDGDPTLEDMQRLLDERTARQWRITETLWLSDFGVNERQVDKYVHGRVLLAGDAAHVHSPAGGQGMNTGMQDAANLAWKIALVERGGANAQLLETYQLERHPIGAAVVKYTSRMLKGAMATNSIVRALRGTVMHLALAVPAVQRKLGSALADDLVTYRGGPLADKGKGDYRPGDGFPDVDMDGRPATDLLRGNEATLVQAGGDAAIECFGVGGFQVATIDAPPVVAEAFGDDVLVRPDGVIAAIGASAIEAWLGRLTKGCPHSG